MIKILETFKPKRKNLKCRCDNCETKFSFDINNLKNPGYQSHDQMGDELWANIKCPTCKKKNRVDLNSSDYKYLLLKERCEKIKKGGENG